MLSYKEFKAIYNSKEYGRMGALYFARQLCIDCATAIKRVNMIKKGF